MFFYDCEKGFVLDNGQDDVTDGTVENYDFNWDTNSQAQQPQEGEQE